MRALRIVAVGSSADRPVTAHKTIFIDVTPKSYISVSTLDNFESVMVIITVYEATSQVTV